MSIRAIDWALDKGRDYELDPTTRHVALVLGNFEGPDGIFPSLATLEDYTGLSERQIRRCIKKLIAVGLLDYGDQSVLINNPKYRNDKLPKVYRFVYVRDTLKPNVDTVGQMPRKKRPWSRKPKPPAPVDNPEPRVERPDTQSRTAGQAGGPTVHQSFNPGNNPSAHADAAPVQVDHNAIYRLRAAARERLASKGMVFADHLFAPMPA